MIIFFEFQTLLFQFLTLFFELPTLKFAFPTLILECHMRMLLYIIFITHAVFV